MCFSRSSKRQHLQVDDANDDSSEWVTGAEKIKIERELRKKWFVSQNLAVARVCFAAAECLLFCFDPLDLWTLSLPCPALLIALVQLSSVDHHTISNLFLFGPSSRRTVFRRRASVRSCVAFGDTSAVASSHRWRCGRIRVRTGSKRDKLVREAQNDRSGSYRRSYNVHGQALLLLWHPPLRRHDNMQRLGAKERAGRLHSPMTIKLHFACVVNTTTFAVVPANNVHAHDGRIGTFCESLRFVTPSSDLLFRHVGRRSKNAPSRHPFASAWSSGYQNTTSILYSTLHFKCPIHTLRWFPRCATKNEPSLAFLSRVAPDRSRLHPPVNPQRF